MSTEQVCSNKSLSKEYVSEITIHVPAVSGFMRLLQ